MYYERIIDGYLREWASRDDHKPLLLRGARQVGKSTAVSHLGEAFNSYVEINFERRPEYKALFEGNLDVKRIVSQMSVICGKPITENDTLLFLDEIQDCPKAIMALRFFREDMPHLHVIAAGSLLEFALDKLPTFGVGRIHSMYMHPMSFDEFLMANGERLLIEARNTASSGEPLIAPIHDKLTQLLRTYMIIGGMPEVVAKWVDTHDFLQCQELQDDIISGYEDDFPKYRKKVNPELLRSTMRSVALQATKKFVYANVAGNYKAAEVKNALDMLEKAGLVVPVVHTDANGLPLGGEMNLGFRKMLLLDTGLLLRLLNMTLGDVSEIATQILTAGVNELVNKGPMAEMLVGIEMMKYLSPNVRHDLFYWVRQEKNAVAEIDYLTSNKLSVMPIEVKANCQGGMKSLWEFMRAKKLLTAVRCSLENFGEFDYVDQRADRAIRHVYICPIYAVSRMNEILNR